MGHQDLHARAANKPQQANRPAPAAPADALIDFDTQLMLLAQAGDREAANSFIRRNLPRISRYINRLIGPTHPVEDLAQDVFLQVLSRADQYHPTAKVSTWLYRIATNTALNHVKQAAVRLRASTDPDSAFEPPDDSAPAPDQKVNLDELKQRVVAAIAALPANQRAALTLFQYEGLSYEQIAAVLDLSVEAVRSLLLRARTALRSQLSGLA